ncbi:rRNA maturation RNase YbeY [Fervidicella metallireducens]|uniref:rRNA maturation RNase YbeY n=1 Tax=Fervidicella metallireducens TaxID=655338 RepID=UPI00055670F7|nr:rRNA maturation RNase YbeY [Fervidicella metallireducens]
MIDFVIEDKFLFTKEIKNLIQKSIQSALKHENFNYPYEINIIITNNEGIRKYNWEFRKKDSATDVLSFPMLFFKDGYFNGNNLDINVENTNPDSGEVILGDMILSIERASEQALEYNHSLEREIAFLTVHSILHLLGHDHETEEERKLMRTKEEEILNSMNLVR